MASAIMNFAKKRYVRHRNTHWFLEKAKDPCDRERRRELLARFREVHCRVRCVHSEREMLFMTDYLLSTNVEGSIVECGCYRGGSSTKLSVVARMTGRRLFLCDSFQGLPQPDAAIDRSYHSTHGSEVVSYAQGEYAVGIDEVRRNITRFGEISVCEFVPGFFSETLPKLGFSPCFVFMDVDLISSARDCIRFLWPRLRAGGRLFTHEAIHEEFILGITDDHFWHETVGCAPPPIFGAGFGCGFDAGAIAYFEKPEKAELKVDREDHLHPMPTVKQEVPHGRSPLSVI